MRIIALLSVLLAGCSTTSVHVHTLDAFDRSPNQFFYSTTPKNVAICHLGQVGPLSISGVDVPTRSCKAFESVHDLYARYSSQGRTFALHFVSLFTSGDIADHELHFNTYDYTEVEGGRAVIEFAMPRDVFVCNAGIRTLTAEGERFLATAEYASIDKKQLSFGNCASFLDKERLIIGTGTTTYDTLTVFYATID